MNLFVEGRWKVVMTLLGALPQTILLFGGMAFCLIASVLFRVAPILGVAPDWISQSGFMPTVFRNAFCVLLLLYYRLPTLLGGLCALLCLLLHLWSGKDALRMGWVKWVFGGSFVVSIFYCWYFAWWHLTGQKFSYL